MSSNDVKDAVNGEEPEVLTPIQVAYKTVAVKFAAQYGERLGDVTTMLRALDQILQRLITFAGGSASMPDLARYVIGSSLARQADEVTRDLYIALSAWNQGDGEPDPAKVTEFFRIQAESRTAFKAVERQFTAAANETPADNVPVDVPEASVIVLGDRSL